MTEVYDVLKKELEGKFVKLNDVSRELCIVGEPIARDSVFVNGRYEEYSPSKHVGLKVRQTIVANVYDTEAGKMRILDKSKAFWLQAFDHLQSDKKAFEKYTFLCRQTGAGAKTRYFVERGREIDDALLAEIEAAPKHDLSRIDQPMPPMSDGPGDQIPF